MNKQSLKFLFWPPCEAKYAQKIIESETKKNNNWEEITTEIETNIKGISNYEELLLIAKELRQTEIKRKDTIENKATTYIYGIGFSCTIVSIVLSLMVEQTKEFTLPSIISIIFYFFSLVLLLVSAYYAIKVRQVIGYHQLTADSVYNFLKSDQKESKRYIAETVADSKMNEIPLLKKSNYLSVAESLFLRGLAFFAFATIISVGFKII